MKKIVMAFLLAIGYNKKENIYLFVLVSEVAKMREGFASETTKS